jgi:nucleoside-diphosphate-sugar epimerase
MAETFIYLFGATRGTGLEVARILGTGARPVVALARSDAEIGELESTGATIVRGDVLDGASIGDSISGAGAIISTLGGKRGVPRPDFDGTRNLVDAALAAGMSRFILVSAAGIGDSHASISEQAHQFLDPVLEIKAKAETYLIDSGLDYTIIRPGSLDSEPASGNGILSDDPTVGGTIHRADLARLVVDCLDNPETIGKIFNAVDRELIGATPL